MRIVFLLFAIALVSCSEKKSEKVDKIQATKLLITSLQLRADSFKYESALKLKSYNLTSDSSTFKALRADNLESLKIESEITILKSELEHLETELKRY